MPQPNFRVVDNEHEHARDIARREVKRFRLDRERERLPICNQYDQWKTSYLAVDQIIQRTLRDTPEETRKRYRLNRYVITVILLVAIFFVIKILIFG